MPSASPLGAATAEVQTGFEQVNSSEATTKANEIRHAAGTPFSAPGLFAAAV